MGVASVVISVSSATARAVNRVFSSVISSRKARTSSRIVCTRRNPSSPRAVFAVYKFTFGYLGSYLEYLQMDFCPISSDGLIEQNLNMGSLIFFVAMSFIPNSFGLSVCRMFPQQKVKFEDPNDITFPSLPLEKVKDKDFVVEQFADLFGVRTYQIRGPDGGLHLARGRSMVTSTGQKAIETIMSRACPSGDKDTFSGLLLAQSKDQSKRILEMAERLTSLPKDKVLCRTSQPSHVSVTDKLFAKLREPPVRPNSGLNQIPYPGSGSGGMYGNGGSYGNYGYGYGYGYGFGSPFFPIQKISANRFELLGQVLGKKDAPRDYRNIADGPEGPAWRNAEVGMYLLRDEFGNIHALKPDELSFKSLNELKSAKFECQREEHEFNMRELPADTFRREPPVTIEH